MTVAERKLYFTALGILLALSAWPLVMGGKIVALQLIDGGITTADYARYVVPYTAICLAVLVTAGIYPLLSRLGRWSVLAATMLALALFVGFELPIEEITVKNAVVPQAIVAAQPVPAGASASAGTQSSTAATWQLFSCVASPNSVKAFVQAAADESSAVGKTLRQNYSDSFRIHYFLVAGVLIALIVGLVYGYGAAYAKGDHSRRLPLRLQLGATVLLLGLCVFANFTGFFRGTQDIQPPLPSVLSGLFFVVLGAAGGVYLGSRLLAKKRALAVVLPSAASVFVCCAMYYGEYRLLGGSLYRFGTSFFFQGLPGIVLAPADILVIALSGCVTAFVLGLASKAIKKEAALKPLPEKANG